MAPLLVPAHAKGYSRPSAAACEVPRRQVTTANLLTTYYLLLTTYYLLPTTYYLLLTTYYLLLTTDYSLLKVATAASQLGLRVATYPVAESGQ